MRKDKRTKKEQESNFILSRIVYPYVIKVKLKTSIMNKGLYRSRNRMIAGVCAGFAESFDFDVTLVRLLYAIATIFTAFSGVIFYIIAWIVIPQKSE